ncbi:hypothetical protein HZ326_31255, partial [Fusarium oxysporum f. sp. albedinis]
TLHSPPNQAQSVNKLVKLKQKQNVQATQETRVVCDRWLSSSPAGSALGNGRNRRYCGGSTAEKCFAVVARKTQGPAAILARRLSRDRNATAA